MNKIEMITNNQLRTDLPEFRVGDTVRVELKVIEGKRTRNQAFEGIVMARKGSKISETFTVRKMSSGVGVDRIIPVHSPNIVSLKVIKPGYVRRAKLNYIRDAVGQVKIKERKVS